MKRRNALKNLGLLTGGLLVFPSLSFTKEKAKLALQKLQVTSEEEELLKHIVGSMIPEGEIPGGVSLKAHLFVWILIDECTTKKNQEIYMNGLRSFQQKTLKRKKIHFTELTESEKLKELNRFIKKKVSKSDISYFLNSTKKIAIFGFMNSEYILTEQMPYKLVPGAFTYEPCKTINPNEKVNINA